MKVNSELSGEWTEIHVEFTPNEIKMMSEMGGNATLRLFLKKHNDEWLVGHAELSAVPENE